MKIVSEKTLVPISTVVIILGAVMWLMTELNHIDSRLARIEGKLGLELVVSK